MAGERVLLRAHERDPVGVYAFSQPVESLLKYFFFDKTFVLDLSVFITGRIGASRPQFSAQVGVRNVGCHYDFLQGFAVELGRKTTVGTGSDVTQGIDGMLPEQRCKPFNGMNRMPDGEQFFHFQSLFCIITAATSL
jgi:hypothetical protein